MSKFCNEQWVTFLQLATSVMSNEQISQRVTSDFLQRANFATSNEWFYNEIISTSNKQRVKSYVSNQLKQKTSMWQPSEIRLAWTLSWRGPSNQWTGFYMITASVMKELILFAIVINWMLSNQQAWILKNAYFHMYY